jgi:hypothetical protein
MSQNRFEYAEICPTCKDAGAVGEDGKPVTIGFDLDTHEISCTKGHVYEKLPSEAAAVAESGDATVAGTRDVALREYETESLAGEVKTGAPEPSSGEAVCPTLETVSDSDAQSNAEADSAALAQLSAQISAEFNVKAEVMSLPAREVAEEKAVLRLAPIEQAPEERRYWVGPGGSMALPNGDLLLGLRIPEQWRQAVEAEAQNQGKLIGEYASDWLTSEEMRSAIVDALVAYWSSSFTQTV